MLIGRLTMTAATAALMLLCALVFMDEATFGVFSTCIGAQLVLSRGVLLGLDSSVVRLHTAAQDRIEPVRAAVSIAGTLGLAALLLGAILAPFQPRGMRWELILAVAFGAVGSAWFDLGCAVVLARLRYRAAGLLTAAMPTIRLGVTLAACVATHDDSLLPSIAFSAATFAAGVVLLVTVARRFGWHAGRAMFWRELQYTKWIGMSDAATVLSIYVGLFVLLSRQFADAAGRYAFGLQLMQGMLAVFLAFYQSLLPRAARLGGLDSLPVFLRDGFRTAVKLALVCAVGAALCASIVPMVLQSVRPGLVGFGPAFLGLSIFVIVLMFEAPLGVTCQFLLRPQLQLLALCVRAATILVCGMWLIPARQDLGAGIAQAIGGTAGLVALFVLVRRAIEAERRRQACAAS